MVSGDSDGEDKKEEVGDCVVLDDEMLSMDPVDEDTDEEVPIAWDWVCTTAILVNCA